MIRIARQRFFAFLGAVTIWAISIGSVAPAIAQELAQLNAAVALRKLSPEEAARGYPVVVHGTATLIDPTRTIFLQDETGGTFAKITPQLGRDVVSGQSITVIGKTFAGLYIPGVDARSIQIDGPGE